MLGLSMCCVKPLLHHHALMSLVLSGQGRSQMAHLVSEMCICCCEDKDEGVTGV